MKEKNTYKDDISIPRETIIYYSKTALLFSLAFYVGIILLGIYFIYNENYFGFNDKQIEIGELDIHFDNLENLLHVYRVRFENNNS